MATVSIRCITGHVTVRDMPDGDVLAMLDEYRHPDTEVLTVTLDDDAVTHVLRRNITRIDVDT